MGAPFTFLFNKSLSPNTKGEVIIMAKKDMKRYYPKHPKNDVAPVPEISGKAKSGKVKAKPILEGTAVPYVKSYHAVPFTNANEIPPAFAAIDNDLAVENIENDFDMTAADLQDFKR